VGGVPHLRPDGDRGARRHLAQGRRVVCLVRRGRLHHAGLDHYYGAALAALKRAHIGFDGVLLKLPLKWRYVAAAAGEAVVFGFFILLAWTGWQVLQVLQGMNLISLPGVPVRFTQSVIPIGAVLFIVCEALSLPEYWRRLRQGVSADIAEVEEQMQVHERTQA